MAELNKNVDYSDDASVLKNLAEIAAESEISNNIVTALLAMSGVDLGTIPRIFSPSTFDLSTSLAATYIQGNLLEMCEVIRLNAYPGHLGVIQQSLRNESRTISSLRVINGVDTANPYLLSGHQVQIYPSYFNGQLPQMHFTGIMPRPNDPSLASISRGLNEGTLPPYEGMSMALSTTAGVGFVSMMSKMLGIQSHMVVIGPGKVSYRSIDEIITDERRLEKIKESTGFSYLAADSIEDTLSSKIIVHIPVIGTVNIHGYRIGIEIARGLLFNHDKLKECIETNRLPDLGYVVQSRLPTEI